MLPAEKNTSNQEFRSQWRSATPKVQLEAVPYQKHQKHQKQKQPPEEEAEAEEEEEEEEEEVFDVLGCLRGMNGTDVAFFPAHNRFLSHHTHTTPEPPRTRYCDLPTPTIRRPHYSHYSSIHSTLPLRATILRPARAQGKVRAIQTPPNAIAPSLRRSSL